MTFRFLKIINLNKILLQIVPFIYIVNYTVNDLIFLLL